MGVGIVDWAVMYMGVGIVDWAVMYMGVGIVDWAVMYMGVGIVDWAVMYMGVGSILPLLLTFSYYIVELFWQCIIGVFNLIFLMF